MATQKALLLRNLSPTVIAKKQQQQQQLQKIVQSPTVVVGRCLQWPIGVGHRSYSSSTTTANVRSLFLIKRQQQQQQNQVIFARNIHSVTTRTTARKNASSIPKTTTKYSFSTTSSGKGRKKPTRPRVFSQSNSNNTTNNKDGASLDGIWYSTTKPPSSKNLEMGKYGLKRLNYDTIQVPVWTVPPHPPTKTLAERVVFPLTILIVGGFILWAYMNPEEDDMTEYWKRVESGQVLMDDDDDDDDLEDDDDDWDDDDEED